MRLAGVIKDDVADGIGGISVSVWMQGCPHRCEGCHNPETWDFDGGEFVNFDYFLSELEKAINVNGIERNLSILGGEPLCPENISYVHQMSAFVKTKFPNSKVIVWTGYTLKELKDSNNLEFLHYVDYLIDGKFDKDLYSPSLKFRGSSNQKIYKKKTGKLFKNKFKFVDVTSELG